MIGDYHLEDTRESPDPCAFAYRAVRTGAASPVEVRVTGGCAYAKSCAAGTCASKPDAATHSHLKSLEHPNLLRIRDLSVEEGCIVYATDLRESTAFEEYLTRAGGMLDPEVALDLLLPIGEALAHLHREGLIHGGLDLRCVQVEQGSERAYLGSFSACAAMGLYGEPECRPGLVDPCPAEILRQQWPPGPQVDVQAFGRVLRHALTGASPGTGGPPPVSLPPELGAMLSETEAGKTTMFELVDRLHALRQTLHRKVPDRRGGADAIREAGRRRKEERRQAQRRAVDRSQLDFTGPVNPRGLARRFSRLGRIGQATLFLFMVALSSQLPLEAMLGAGPEVGPAQGRTRAIQKKPEPIRKRPKPAPKKPEPARSPQERALQQMAAKAWENPTGPETYGKRLKTVWAFVKSLPTPERENVASKKTLLGIRKISARSPDQGYRELDRLIQRCQQHLKDKDRGS